MKENNCASFPFGTRTSIIISSTALFRISISTRLIIPISLRVVFVEKANRGGEQRQGRILKIRSGLQNYPELFVPEITIVLRSVEESAQAYGKILRATFTLPICYLLFAASQQQSWEGPTWKVVFKKSEGLRKTAFDRGRNFGDQQRFFIWRPCFRMKLRKSE